MGRVSRSLSGLLVIVAACTSASTTSGPAAEPDAAFAVQGDPESAAGARWSYRGTVQGTQYDLQGILLKPRGAGPFPAVLVSHGAGGNVDGYSRAIAVEMVRWGVVVMATNYTHAGGVPIGAPGSAAEPGASAANVQRARKVYDLLTGLSYVDRNRVAAHGHSMGAFVTAATAGAHPALFRVASVTGGGVRPGTVIGEFPAPVESQVVNARVPYQLHHGELDNVVPVSQARRFEAILLQLGVPHELFVYAGEGHNEPSRSALVLERIRAWYGRHGLF